MNDPDRRPSWESYFMGIAALVAERSTCLRRSVGAVIVKDKRISPDMPQREIDHLLALYDGEIAWVDSEVGRLADALAERGLLDDTEGGADAGARGPERPAIVSHGAVPPPRSPSCVGG